MLVQQVLICKGNKPQIQSNHIIIHRKNLFFLLKAGPGLKCKFTAGTPSMISHNEVDKHYYSPDTIQKEMRAMPLSFPFISAQTITEEQDSKQRLPVVT